MRVRGRLRIRAGIPSASMADLALLLLIFFMTTTFFQVERGPTISLPEAENSEERSREDAIMLHVDVAGALYWDGRPQPMEELSQRFDAMQKRRPVSRVLMYADATTPFDFVYPVLQALRGENPIPVVLAVDPIATGVGTETKEDAP